MIAYQADLDAIEQAFFNRVQIERAKIRRLVITLRIIQFTLMFIYGSVTGSLLTLVVIRYR